MKTKFLFITVFTIFFLACDQQQEKKGASPVAQIPKVNKSKEISKEIIDKLYYVNPVYDPYMPDSSIHFKNADSLREYKFLIWDKFDKFCKLRSGMMDNKDSVILENRAAGIHYSELREVIDYNFIKENPRENGMMLLLGNYSPNSDIITLQQRINLFNSFPEKVKNNEIGKKTWERIQEYSFDKNIGLNVREFDVLEIKDTDNQNIKLKSIFNNVSKFYVLVFGASWCLPCRLEELQLKHWTNFIDTSTIKIVGLSIDRDFGKWKKYIGDDGLPWACYLLAGEMNNSLVKKLKFEGVPRNFLLDESGKILAENTDIRKILKLMP